jgi:hypothetical protein
MRNDANYRHNLELQVKVAQAYITLWQTEINSGFYKTRQMYHGTKPVDSAKFTEEELLKDSVQTLHRHVDRLRELTEELMLPVDE